ncbi:MAG: patatin-like phospholipase family protein [Acetobacter aceti]|nr:patatin-like phospholipase family protein [Acetobacter aceti]
MNMPSKERALVLGGGGITGIAWETGVLAGLARGGLDVVASADVIIGTSAGATVAAQITSSMSVSALYRRQIDGTLAREPDIDLNVSELIARFSRIMTSEPDALHARKTIGALALERDRVFEAERRAIIENRLPSHTWPVRGADLRLTAIDAHTGMLRVFDARSGVDLVDAVAASCAIAVVWPAVTIADTRYMDGSFRSATNEDLAQGFRRVIVLQPMNLGTTSDVRPLSASSDVHVVRPDEAAIAAMTAFLDPAAAADSAREGYRQGYGEATRLARMWCS